MSVKKLFLFSLLIYIFVSSAFSQPVAVRQLSTLSVLGSKSESEIQFTVTEDEGDSKTITILPFSYKDKTVDPGKMPFPITLMKKEKK